MMNLEYLKGPPCEDGSLDLGYLGLKRERRRRESGLEIERNKHNKDVGNNENSR